MSIVQKKVELDIYFNYGWKSTKPAVNTHKTLHKCISPNDEA